MLRIVNAYCVLALRYFLKLILVWTPFEIQAVNFMRDYYYYYYNIFIYSLGKTVYNAY